MESDSPPDSFPRKRKESPLLSKQKEPLLKSTDVAHILDCSPDDVIELARKKKLKGTKEGRFWRFRLQDVLEYKKQQEKGGRQNRRWV